MLKRLRWITLGAGVGVGGTLWARRTVRQRIDRYRVDRLWPQGLSRDVRAAVAEGRDAMRQREAELRAQLERAGRNR
jgi:hypothetical protein